MKDLMYIPFDFENGGTRVIHYSPEDYVPKEMKRMKTVIMAGGRGTRISLFPDIPKPMIKIDGEPVLERELIS